MLVQLSDSSTRSNSSGSISLVAVVVELVNRKLSVCSPFKYLQCLLFKADVVCTV